MTIFLLFAATLCATTRADPHTKNIKEINEIKKNKNIKLQCIRTKCIEQSSDTQGSRVSSDCSHLLPNKPFDIFELSLTNGVIKKQHSEEDGSISHNIYETTDGTFIITSKNVFNINKNTSRHSESRATINRLTGEYFIHSNVMQLTTDKSEFGVVYSRHDEIMINGSCSPIDSEEIKRKF